MLTTIASLIILGIAEVLAGFRHTLFGARTVPTAMATYLGAGMGALYTVAGVQIFTKRKSAALITLCLLGAVILGCVAMVVADLYPTESVSQLLAIVLETSFACAFLVAVALK